MVFDRAKRRLGVCKHKRKHIGISSYMSKDPQTTAPQVKNTSLHEIAHAVVGPSRKSHGPEWKAKAISIGCDGECCGHSFVSTPRTYEYRCRAGCWSVIKRLKWQALADKLKKPCHKCGGRREYLFNGKPCKTKAA